VRVLPSPSLARLARPLPQAGEVKGKSISFSRRVFAPELCQTANERPPDKEGRRSAERRIQPCPRHTSRRCHLNMRGARQRALRSPLAFRRSTAALAEPDASSIGSAPDPRFLRPGRAGRYPAKPVTVYRAPRGPVVVPVGRGPRAARVRGYEPRPREPPRSIKRPSPVDVPKTSRMALGITNGDYCQ
jgi:hypothetical protein